jgi:hypothetical protein
MRILERNRLTKSSSFCHYLRFMLKRRQGMAAFWLASRIPSSTMFGGDTPDKTLTPNTGTGEAGKWQHIAG